MADFPGWDYWMWDDEGKYIYENDSTMAEHPDAEFLSKTGWDDKWVQTAFWTPEQAAALSFGRSPDKVPWNDDPFGVKKMEGSSEFANYFCELRDVILSAQEQNTLPTPILALTYVRWAEANGIPFPPALAVEIVAFHKSIQEDGERYTKLLEEMHRMQEELERLKADAEIHPRTRTNMLRVILGVAKDKYHFPSRGRLSVFQMRYCARK